MPVIEPISSSPATLLIELSLFILLFRKCPEYSENYLLLLLLLLLLLVVVVVVVAAVTVTIL
jgi:hypothetical protein